MSRNRRLSIASAVLVGLMATLGCDRPIDEHSDSTAKLRDTTAMVAVSESPSAVAQGTLQREPQAKVQEIENPQAELAALQSTQAALRIERERLARQLETHQAEGQKRLAKLKAQWAERKVGSGPGDAAARERFAESARVEMESALMMDQEYRAHLEEAENSLRDTERRMIELRKQAAGEPQ